MERVYARKITDSAFDTAEGAGESAGDKRRYWHEKGRSDR